MSESFAAKRSLPPPGQPFSEEPEGRATPEMPMPTMAERRAALVRDLIELAQERCARCGRILRRPVTVDGIIYGRICATKVLPPAMTWSEVIVPVVDGVALLPDGRVYQMPPGVLELRVAVLNR